jgi:hypothetical protein
MLFYMYGCPISPSKELRVMRESHHVKVFFNGFVLCSEWLRNV